MKKTWLLLMVLALSAVLLAACASRGSLSSKTIVVDDDDDASPADDAFPCGPQDCTGCCDASKTCQSGYDQQECGYFGEPCLRSPSVKRLSTWRPPEMGVRPVGGHDFSLHKTKLWVNIRA